MSGDRYILIYMIPMYTEKWFFHKQLRYVVGISNGYNEQAHTISKTNKSPNRRWRALENGTVYDGRGNDIDFGPAPNTVYVT